MDASAYLVSSSGASRSLVSQFRFPDEAFTKTDVVLVEALKCGKQLTRSNLAEQIKRSGINVGLNNLRLIFIMLHAELGIICSGALQGKEHTYALLDERAPQTKMLTHDEALAEVTERYFKSMVRQPSKITVGGQVYLLLKQSTALKW